MLSVRKLREYCRTCLIKLQKSDENVASKSIPINKFPELEHLIQICLSNKDTVGGDSLCFYAPFICRSCFDKWLDFVELYQIAINADETMRKAFQKEDLKTGNKIEDVITTGKIENTNECIIDNETLLDIIEVEKYVTDSVYFTSHHHSNNPLNINCKVIPDDKGQLKTRIEHSELNSTRLVTQDEECNRSSSDNMSEDIGLISEVNKRRVYIKNMQKSRSARKSFCALKKSCKTRNTVRNTSENNISLNKRIEKVDPGDYETKKVRYQCDQCTKYFWEKNKYDGHMKQVHEGIRRPYKCEQCDKAYNLYKTLLQHKRECHCENSQEVFKCDQCDKNFKTAVILKQHLSNKHSEQKETMRSICDQCGFIAAHQYSLSRHIINKHTETDQIKCDMCPKVFKTQYSLKYHVMGNHNPSNIKPFKCPECQMGFTRKTLLNQHKRTHIKYNERIKCDFEGCKVRFVKHGDKTHHMRLVHLKVKQHVCDFCGEAFGAMQTLRHHRFIHTGEKPYKCNVCGQGFRQRTAMKTHRKTHVGKESERQDVINNLPEINLSLISNLSS